MASEEGTESRSLMCNVLHYFFNLVLSIFPLKSQFKKFDKRK